MIEYIEYKKTKVESVVEVSCLDGFFMVPSHDTVTYTCQPDDFEGTWNNEVVQCLRSELIEIVLRMVVLFFTLIYFSIFLVVRNIQ